MEEITGILKNARIITEHDPRAPCLSGDVYGDKKGRFPGGEYIVTSTIESHKAGGIIKTRYSTYKVESWY